MPKMKNSFKDLHSFETRLKMGENFRKNYPGKIPVIVQRSADCRVGSDKAKKYIMPVHLSFGHLYFLVRSYLHLRPEEAVVLYVKNVIPASASTLGSIYEAYHDEDLFLYVVYQDESVYGCSDLPSEKKSGNSNNEEEENNDQENQGNPPGAGPNPVMGGNVVEPANDEPLPTIQVDPPEGNGGAAGPSSEGAAGPSSEGASGGASGSSNTTPEPVSPYYQPRMNSNSFSRLVVGFFLANRRLLQTANGTDRARPPSVNPTGPQPNVLTGEQDRQPLQDISGAMSNVNVSYGDELELAAGDTSDESSSDEEDSTVFTTEAVVERAIGDTGVTAGGSAEAAMGWLSEDVEAAVGGLTADTDAATGGPTWEAAIELGGSAGDADDPRGSPHRDNDSGAGSIAGDFSHGLGSIGEAYATDTTSMNEDSGAGTYGGIDALGEDATGDSVSSAGSAVGEVLGEDPAFDGDGPAGDEGHDGGNAGDGLAGDGLAGDGLAGDGLAGDGLAGEGPAGEGPAGEGPAGEGPAGDESHDREIVGDSDGAEEGAEGN